MQAEGNPLDESSPLAAPLEAVTRLVLRAPGVVVVGSVLLAALAVLVTVNGLNFKTSRLDLLNPRSEYNQRWLAYLAEFGERDDAVVVVRSDDPNKLAAAIDDLAAQAAAQPELFESIFYRRDLSRLKSKALFFLPPAELARIDQEVQQATAMLPQPGKPADPAAALAELNEQLTRARAANPEAREAFERQYSQIAGRLLAMLNPSASANPQSAIPNPQSPIPTAEFSPQYLLADEGRMGFVLLKLKIDEGEFARGSRAIAALRKIIGEARPRHPRAWIGLTGMPVIEFDEMQASQTDMVWTSLLSLAGVAVLFAAGYGGLRHAALACGVLLLAMAYSFGFITLAIGHLNILSSAFAVVLIGLGIDFGIHYIASYLKLRGEGCDERTAMIRTASDVGPGMVTGGVTTAAAFFMAAMTDFIGVRELGVVAGSGVLLCVLATALVLPPLVVLVDRQFAGSQVPSILPGARWFGFSLAWPRFTLTAAAMLTLVAAAGFANLRYDHNLLNLQPRHLESADIERQVFTKMDDSVWFAVSICQSREELLERKARFVALPSVAKTEEIASLLPAATREQERLVKSIHERLDALSAAASRPRPVAVEGIVQEIDRAQKLLAEETPFETETTVLLARLRQALASQPVAATNLRLAAANAALLSAVQSQLADLGEVCDPTPPQLADLPRELVDRFVGRTHHHLLRVYARGDIWNMDKMAKFVADVESVDRRVTGHPVQTYYGSRHMQQSYIKAGVYALVAVLVLLWIDFRSLGHSLLAMVPLGLGFTQLCGLLGWLDIPLNPANMIVLPLILGIGVDDGVHLVHEWRRQRGQFRLSNSTTVAVLLTSTTTMASFGSLILARHQGLQSLGQVLTLGVLTCLSSSILFFPALLAILSRHRQEETEDELEVEGSAEMELEPALILTRVAGVELSSTPVSRGRASLECSHPEDSQSDPESEPIVLRFTPTDVQPAPAPAAETEADEMPQILAFESRLSSTPEEPLETPAAVLPRRRALPRRAGEVPAQPASSTEREPTPLDHLAAHIRQSQR